MTVSIRSGVSDGAIQYDGADKVTVNSGNVTVTGDAIVSSNLTVTGSGLTVGGSQVLTATNGGLGYNQTWQNFPIGTNPVTQRQAGSTYTNSTGKPISITVGAPGGLGNTINSLFVDGILVSYWESNIGGNSNSGSLYGIVPPNSIYMVTHAGAAATINAWVELR